MRLYPQQMRNVRTSNKAAITANSAVLAAVDQVSLLLGNRGRVLLRESGTEPVVRLMVEAEEEELCRTAIETVIAAIRTQVPTAQVEV
jgi:phosphoglucosamine mutase